MKIDDLELENQEQEDSLDSLVDSLNSLTEDEDVMQMVEKPKTKRRKKVEDEVVLNAEVLKEIEEEVPVKEVLSDESVQLAADADLLPASAKRKLGLPSNGKKKADNPTDLKMAGAYSEKKSSVAKYQIIHRGKA